MSNKTAFTIIGYVLFSFGIVGILAYFAIWFQNWEWGQMGMFRHYWWVYLPSIALLIAGARFGDFWGDRK
ncbi:MAG: hypothetical protein ACW99U_22180 [Candidatus Thorarchaeota archaeon]|jgi:hypothetical protein